jgi:hypothetical protein
MTREEIEEWIETRSPDAVERLPEGSRSVKKWVQAYARILIEISKEETVEETTVDDVDDLDEDLDDDGEDEPDDDEG